ncbi:MAG TPA: UTP--glucose-1-phosphate uridylyltransferase, partial [Humisphaera sp.]
MSVAALREKLKAAGQDHLLRFHDALPPAGKAKLEAQLAALDLGLLKSLAGQYVTRKPEIKLPTDIKPVTPFPRTPHPGQEKLYADALARGKELLKAGKVGAFLVAGGQGTRLGYDGPKGEYKVTPIKQKPLFQTFAEQLLNHSRTSGKSIPWYIMTSEVNDAPTRAFFEKHSYFGYPKADVFFFQQGMMPAFAADGTLLLGEQDSLALSPDGHGGSLRALDRSGALADMKRRGVEHLSYFQVDNPLVHTIDPLFLGLHDLTGSEM